MKLRMSDRMMMKVDDMWWFTDEYHLMKRVRRATFSAKISSACQLSANRYVEERALVGELIESV
jgi:hypothetical protein